MRNHTHLRLQKPPAITLLALFMLTILMSFTVIQPASAQDYDRIITVEAGPDVPFRLKEIFLTVQPGTVIELPQGTYYFDDELVLNTSHITLRGQGKDKTTLSFKDQPQGAQGILVLSNAFVVEDLAIEDTAGDGIRVEGADGVIFRRLRVEWTNGPDEENGAYGIYPVLCRNVLVEDSIVKGASDAGIYVGQSADIVVRRNVAEFNVAGIEIENSINADVYENLATKNTGGILIFDLPGLSQAGHHTRVFNNRVIDNNTKNFAPAGNIVGKVPTGTGVMVLSTDFVDIYDNEITGNVTTNFALVSFKSIQLLDGSTIPDTYDPYPEHITFHNNAVQKPGGWHLDGGEFTLLANMLFFLKFKPVSDIVVDGWWRTDLETAQHCLYDNTQPNGNEATMGNMQINKKHWFLGLLGIPGTPAKLGYDQANRCQMEAFPAVILDFSIFNVIPDPEPEYTPEEIAAYCAGGDTNDVNWDAFLVNCPSLSSYRLFANATDPTGAAKTDRGVPYDLTTPLFSDYANKYRYVFIPGGATATYAESDPLDFPIGSIIAKSFALPLASGVEKVIETRLLIKRAEGWAALPYIWDSNMTEATLALGGGAMDADIIDPDGNYLTVNYRVPNANQCTGCHGQFGQDKPIGPKARLLNKDYTYALAGGSQTKNQLQHWVDAGLLSATSAELANAPRLATWNDITSGSEEERARAYLETNCAHCHSVGGRAYATGLLLEAHQPLDSVYGLCKSPVAAGKGSGGLSFDIVPGDADKSILNYRLESEDPAIRMPELGRSVVHTQGALLVRNWIDNLTGNCETQQ